MADIADRVPGILIQDSDTEIAEVPADETWIDAALVLCNVSGAERWVTVYIVPSGESSGPEYAILYEAPLKAPQTLELGRGYNMMEGDKLIAICDEADGVSAYLSMIRRDIV